MSLRALGSQFKNQEVPGDGSCLVHSICVAIDKKYKSLQLGDQRREYVRNLRKDLAKCILEYPDFQEYITKDLPGIKDSHYPGKSDKELYQILANELLSNHSLFYYHAPILGYYFSYENCKIDIVLLQADILKGKRNGIPVYGLATHNYIKGNAKAYIMIMCTQNHYSLLTSVDGIKKAFSPKAQCIKELLELLKKQ